MPLRSSVSMGSPATDSNSVSDERELRWTSCMMAEPLVRLTEPPPLSRWGWWRQLVPAKPCCLSGGYVQLRFLRIKTAVAPPPAVTRRLRQRVPSVRVQYPPLPHTPRSPPQLACLHPPTAAAPSEGCRLVGASRASSPITVLTCLVAPPSATAGSTSLSRAALQPSRSAAAPRSSSFPCCGRVALTGRWSAVRSWHSSSKVTPRLRFDLFTGAVVLVSQLIQHDQSMNEDGNADQGNGCVGNCDA